MQKSLLSQESTQHHWSGSERAQPAPTGSSDRYDSVKFGAHPQSPGCTYPSPPMSGSPPPPRHFAPGYGEYEQSPAGSRTEAPHQGTFDEHAATRAWQMQQARVAPSKLPRGPASSLHFLTQSHPNLDLSPVPHHKGSYGRPEMSHKPPLHSSSPVSASRVPRRTKAHVPSACVNCKKAHLACDVERPCRRCVGTGREDSCVDVQHKKRGRPRLRDERDLAREEPDLGLGLVVTDRAGGMSSLLQSYNPLFQPAPHHSGHFRVLKAQNRARGASRVQMRSLGRVSLADVHVMQGSDTRSPGRNPPTSGAMAFLRLDLNISSFDSMFPHVFGVDELEVQGHRLFDLVDSSDHLRLHRLIEDSKHERQARDPHYLPPIYDHQELERVSETSESELSRLTRGFTPRSETLRIRRHEQAQTITAHFQLAKNMVYFLVMTIIPTPLSQPDPRHFVSHAKPVSSEHLHTHGRTRSWSGPPLPGHPPSYTSLPYPTHADDALVPTRRERAERLASSYHLGEQHLAISPSHSTYLIPRGGPSYRSAPTTPPVSEAIGPLSFWAGFHDRSTPPHLRPFQLAPIRDLPGALSDGSSNKRRPSHTSTRQSDEDGDDGDPPRKRDRISVREMLE